MPLLFLLDFPDHTILLEREILLHDAINFKTEIFIKFHIFLVMGLYGIHHPVGVGLVDGFLHETGGNAVVLHVWVYRKIDDVEPLVLVKLIRPAGI